MSNLQLFTQKRSKRNSPRAVHSGNGMDIDPLRDHIYDFRYSYTGSRGATEVHAWVLIVLAALILCMGLMVRQQIIESREARHVQFQNLKAQVDRVSKRSLV